MTKIIRIGDELFAKSKSRIDLLFIVKPVVFGKYKLGRIHMQDIDFPDEFVGKKFKIRLEEVINNEHGTNTPTA